MELITLIVTNPLSLVVISILFLLIAIFAGPIKIDLKTKTISIGRIKHAKSNVLKAYDLTRFYTREIDKAENSIFRNQMNYGEKTLEDIACKINLTKTNLYIPKLKLKIAMRENGFEVLPSEAFSRYVGLKIDMFRSEFKELSQDPYINSPDFSDKIGEIFNYALNCANVYGQQMRDLETILDKELDKLAQGG